jgi:hypothetical protein
MADNPNLSLDLRRKVLQHLDELERTMRIRQLDYQPPAAKCSGPRQSGTASPPSHIHRDFSRSVDSPAHCCQP